MIRCIFGVAALMLAIGPLEAAGPMDEHQARAKAIEILMGDPYGSAAGQVSKTIRDARLDRDGNTLCGKKKRAVWRLHIAVDKPVNNPASPIDGYLFLDAVSGKLVCTNLPMLD
ncbi:MAG: hypothetical protein HY765_04525 [Rhodomicrobium sp.]|nr:hypothetical protein [Rhodomicrobium sp.]